MEKEITIKVKITEGFADEIIGKEKVSPSRGATERTFDEKVDEVISRFMNPLYKAMANYAIKEQKNQVQQAEYQATEAVKELVVITKNETNIQS